ncbi:hypothetical protein D3C76_1066370 [compost metagenome]
MRVLSRLPSTFRSSAQGVAPGAGKVNRPSALNGQSPPGFSRPESFRLNSSRCNCTESIRRPSAVQWATNCSPLSCSLPLNDRLPTCTSPSSMASGKSRSGRLIGPLLGSSAEAGNCKATWSALSCSMHRVMRARHSGDQANISRSTSTRLASCCHST